MTAYTIFRLIIALVVGAVCFLIDRHGGTGLYRWWYGMTHEKPLPGDIHQGFVHNRTTRSRVVFATILSSLISIVAIAYSDYNPLLELGLWLLSIPVIVAAFMAGPRIAAMWNKRDDMYSSVDKWERGEIDISDQLKQKSAELTASVRKSVTPAANSSVDPQPKLHTDPREKESAPPLQPEEDPQELVNRFINRGKP